MQQLPVKLLATQALQKHQVVSGTLCVLCWVPQEACGQQSPCFGSAQQEDM
jgi:hypothetical protein